MKFFLSGADTQHQLDLMLDANCKYFAFAYSNMKRHSYKKLEGMIRSVKERNGIILIDPTTDYIQRKLLDTWSKESVEKYWTSYFNFVESFSSYIDVIASLDLIGSDYDEIVSKSRKDCIDYINRNTAKAIITIRKSYNEDGFFDNDLHENIIIGIGNDITESTTPIKLKKIIKHNKNKYIKEKRLFHGWGISAPETINKVPFYSTSSASWTVGARYGSIYDYHKRLQLERVINTKHTEDEKIKIKKKMKRRVETAGIDFQNFLGGDGTTLSHWNCLCFVAYQYDVEKIKKNKEYFNKEQTSKTALATKEQSSTALESTSTENKTLVETNEDQYDQYKKSIQKLAKSKGLNVAKQCNSCEISDICPLFEEDSECKLESKFEFVGFGGLRAMYERMLSMQMELLEKQMVKVQVAGEGLDEMQNMIEQSQSLMSGFEKLLRQQNKQSIKIEGEGVAGVSVLGALLSNIGRGSLNAQGTHTHPSQRAANKHREEKAIQEEQDKTNEIIDAEFEENDD